MAVDDPGDDVGQIVMRFDVAKLDEVDGSRFRRHSLEAVAAIAVKEMPSMNEVTTVGLDLAKRVFQVHGADAKGRPVLQKKLRREEVLSFFAKLPPCVVGMEACASSHYWAREIRALGHDTKMIPERTVQVFDTEA
jgi:transposase